MKTAQSYDYWRKRQDARLAYSERVSNQTISNIGDVYDDSLKRVESRIENILDNYSKSIKMPKDQLKELLSQHDKEALLRELQDDLIKNGANTNENMKWLRGNYLSRLNNQESIKLQLENERRIITENEKAISTLGYKKTIGETYKSLTNDLSGKTRELNESAKNSMLNKRWVADKNYSERVWKNSGRLTNEIDKVINSSLLSGVPKNEIINDLSERYEVAKYRAETLVRTEMNYFENQSELKSYEDLGVTHYTYLAVRDNRTSSICSELDGTRHAVKDAKPGVNYPPMHPNCRAGTIPDLEFEENYRVYRDPITRNREKTTKSYDDWIESKRQSHDKGPKAYDIEVKKVKNLTSDKKKYKKFENVLGKGRMPKKVSSFQSMMYNDSKEWSRLSDNYFVKERIKKGKFSSLINEDKQKPHNKVSAGKGKSYLLDDVDAQLLFDEFAGTGSVIRNSKGRTHQEITDTGRIIGYDFRADDFTTWIKIHHSKKRTHIVPFKPRIKKKGK
ncbi:minor capsid protein [Erysipelothrix urinaevulpis]|uniref:minor capsid protein n=1 Tax=Erysipelothrix urinaevulpis TaxID=2683717 RepID=UPI001359E4BA|nr:minor capsid protein [Erysipelothrix urinaevulpis]